MLLLEDLQEPRGAKRNQVLKLDPCEYKQENLPPFLLKLLLVVFA